MSKISRRSFLKRAGAMSVASLMNSEFAPQVPTPPPWPVYLPQVQKTDSSDRSNIITIVADNLRYDHIGFYGNSWIQTPNIDAFAAKSQVFDKMYVGGFPTVINRAELFTGRYMFHRMGWSDLPDGETVLATILADNNYLTGLIFDNWHIKDHGFSFDRGFQSWEWIRGQEGDRYRALPLHPIMPCSEEKLRDSEEVRQYLRNQAEVSSEDQYCTARTIQAAIEWLKRYAKQSDFYLHIDCFDPHEPWNPPTKYIDLYSSGYTGERVVSPAYAPPTYLSQAELNHAQALYAAEITMVDHWLGVLFVLTVLAGILVGLVLAPAIEIFLAYLTVSLMYVQVVDQASSFWVLFSLMASIVFLAANLGVVLVTTAFFLGTSQKLFQARFREGVPLGQHRRFWLWGSVAVVWALVLPVLYILVAQEGVAWLAGKMIATGSWPLVLGGGPALFLLGFAVVFWAARGARGLGFIKRYRPAPPPPTAPAGYGLMAAPGTR